MKSIKQARSISKVGFFFFFFFYFSENFVAVGAYSVGKMTKEELRTVEKCACPGAGSCPGMFTANTMATGIILYSIILYYMI